MSIVIGIAQMAAAVAVFWVPGLALLWAAGPCGTLRRLALAPAVTVGLFAVCSMAASWLGVRWTLPLATGCVVVTTGVIAMLRRRRSLREAVRPSTLYGSIRACWALVAVVALVALLQLGVVAQALFVPDRLPTTWDSTFHFNALQYVRLVGVVDPATFGSLVDSSGATRLYPSGWHAVAGLAPVWLGTTTAMAAVSYAPVAIAWTLGLATLTREVVPRSRVAVPALAAAMAVCGLATPLWVALRYGMLPYAMGVALLPGMAAVVVAAFRERGAPRRAATWGALAIAGLGLGACHPGALTGLVLVVLPWCGTAVLDWWRGARRLPRVAGTAALVAFLTAAALFVGRDGLVRVVRESDTEGGPVRLGSAVLELVTGQTTQSVTYAVIPVLLALVAMWIRVRRHEDLRPVAAWALIAVVYVLAVTRAPWAQAVTGLFYSEGRRIGPVLAVWTSVLAAEGLVRISGAMAGRVQLPARLGATGATVLLAGVVVLINAAAPLVTWAGAAATTYTTSISPTTEDPSHNPYFTVGELAMAHRLPQELPAGSRILGSGFSGVSHLYGLVGLDVLPFYVQPTADLRAAVEHFADLESDPTVCAALRAHRVTHIYVDPFLAKGMVYPYSDVAFSHLPARGLKLVDTGGTAAVYRITACGG